MKNILLHVRGNTLGKKKRRRVAIYGISLFLFLLLTEFQTHAWNPPGRDEFQTHFLQKEGIEFNINKGKWTGYVSKAHGFLTQRSIELLFKDSDEGRRAAMLYSNSESFSRLLEGLRIADHFGKDVSFVLKTCVPNPFTIWPYICFEIFSSSSFFNEESYTHYTPGLNLRFENAAETFIEFSPWMPGIDEVTFLITSLLGLPDVVKLRLSSEPDIEKRHRSAHETIKTYYEKALDIYKTGVEKGAVINAWRRSLFYLGWSLHLVQDMGVPYHVFGEWRRGHAAFESYADDFRNNDKYFTANEIAFHQKWSPQEYVLNAAIETSTKFGAGLFNDIILNNIQDIVFIVKKYGKPPRGKAEKWREGIKKEYEISQRYGSGLLLKFLRDIEHIPTPLVGVVKEYVAGSMAKARAVGPVSDVCIFFRPKYSKTGRWSLTRTDKNGRYRIDLKPGITYLIRPAMPGFVFVDSRNLSPCRPYIHYHELEPNHKLSKNFVLLRRPGKYATDSSSDLRGRCKGHGEILDNAACKNARKMVLAQAEDTAITINSNNRMGMPLDTDVKLFFAYPYKHDRVEPILTWNDYANHFPQIFVDRFGKVLDYQRPTTRMFIYTTKSILSFIQHKNYAGIERTTGVIQKNQIRPTPVKPKSNSATGKYKKKGGVIQSNTTEFIKSKALEMQRKTYVLKGAERKVSLSEKDKEIIKMYLEYMEKLRQDFPTKIIKKTDSEIVYKINMKQHGDIWEFLRFGLIPFPLTADGLHIGDLEMAESVKVKVEILNRPGYVRTIEIRPIWVTLEDYGQKVVKVVPGSEAGIIRIIFTVTVSRSEVIKDLTKDIEIEIHPSLTGVDTFQKPIQPRLILLDERR